jgi:3-hydroxyisobutyrate dehydrogenase
MLGAMTETDHAVGLVGLGRMGMAMLGRLRAQGFAVRAHDAAPGPCAAAAAVGAELPGGVAGCAAPVVLLSLPDAPVVAEVLAALWPALPARAVVVDCSTLAPGAARGFAAEAAARGLAYLDAPVSGGPAGAAAGTLAVMLGGDAAAVVRAEPVLAALAQRIVHVGGPGAGQVAKLANNLLVATHLMAAAEALRMADAAGVAPEALLPVINAASGRSAATEVNWPRWITPGGFDSGFAAGLMRKDVRLACALAEAAGAPLDVCAAAARLWEESAVPDEADFNRAPAALFAARADG